MSDTTIEELARQMLAAAKEATPGPWEHIDDVREGRMYSVASDGRRLAEYIYGEDARFIALASPENVTRLADDYRDLHADHAKLLARIGRALGCAADTAALMAGTNEPCDSWWVHRQIVAIVAALTGADET